MLPQNARQRSSGLLIVRVVVLFVGGLFFAAAGLLGYSTARRAVTVPLQPAADTSSQIVVGVAAMIVAAVLWQRGRR